MAELTPLAPDVAQGYIAIDGRAVVRVRATEIRVVMAVFNDAWSENWGALPFTEGELRQLARDLQRRRSRIEEDRLAGSCRSSLGRRRRG